MLDDAFVAALAGAEELVVTSRDGDRERSVRAWFVIAPPGVLYLFSEGFARRIARWRDDPWVRLTIPGTASAIEGRVHFVSLDELNDSLVELITERWAMWGAVTPQGLRRMLGDGSHVLYRVDAPHAARGSG